MKVGEVERERMFEKRGWVTRAGKGSVRKCGNGNG
jgi:hypothetical protein